MSSEVIEGPWTGLLERLLYHVEEQPGTLGFGIDQYSEDPIHHPMAYALYARGFVNLHALTGEDRFLASAEQALTRLDSLRAGGTDPCWGLGFSWRRPESEPYAVTTAICTQAFADYAEATGSGWALEVARMASRWLVDELPWKVTPQGSSPWFSPQMPYALPNVASLTAGALARVGTVSGDPALWRPCREAAHFVLARQHPTGFWTYGYAGASRVDNVRPPDVIDATHSGYTLDGIVTALNADCSLPRHKLRAAVRRGARFVGRNLVDPDGRIREKVVKIDRQDPWGVRLAARPNLPVIDERSTTLVSFPAETRLAGYGAVIAAFARGALEQLVDPHAVAPTVARLYRTHMADPAGRFIYMPDEPGPYPRHEAHLFEGLSALLLVVARDRPTGCW